MWRFLVILLLFTPIYIDQVSIGAEPPGGVSRVTTSFDLRYTEAVLKRVSRVLSGGLDGPQIDTLLREINAMKAETPMAWHFTVTYKNLARNLEIRALVDDLGMIDLDFATDAELAAAIRTAVDGYLNRRG